MALKDLVELMECSSNRVVVDRDTPDDHEAAEEDIPDALVEMETKSNAILRRLYQPHDTVLHIFLVGRASAPTIDYAREDIHAQDVLLRVIDFVRCRGWPLYLEATSLRSRALFESVGFEVAQEVKIGEGRVDGDGAPAEAGSGVSLWVATLDVR